MTTVSVNPKIANVANTIATEIEAFRKAAVTSENKATPFARAILASLVAGTQTQALVTSAVLHNFGNPKSPKGKPLDKLTASGDHIVGFGATRKAVTAAFDVFDNIDADAFGNVLEDGDGTERAPGAAAIRPLVYSFILNETGSPKSLAALVSAVKSAIAAHTAATMPANDNGETEGETGGTDKGEATPTPTVNLTVAQRIAELIVAIQADPESLVAGGDADNAVTALYATINETYAFLMEAATPDVAVNG